MICRLGPETIRQAGNWTADAFASHYVKTVPLKTMLCAAGFEDPGNPGASQLYYIPRLKLEAHVTEAMLDAKSRWLPRLRAMVHKVRLGQCILLVGVPCDDACRGRCTYSMADALLLPS